MTYATTGTSVRRNLPYLLPAERAVFEPTEAELIAADRSRALAKDNGTLERLEAYWANLDQVRADSMSGGRS